MRPEFQRGGQSAIGCQWLSAAYLLNDSTCFKLGLHDWSVCKLDSTLVEAALGESIFKLEPES